MRKLENWIDEVGVPCYINLSSQKEMSKEAKKIAPFFAFLLDHTVRIEDIRILVLKKRSGWICSGYSSSFYVLHSLAAIIE